MYVTALTPPTQPLEDRRSRAQEARRFAGKLPTASITIDPKAEPALVRHDLANSWVAPEGFHERFFPGHRVSRMFVEEAPAGRQLPRVDLEREAELDLPFDLAPPTLLRGQSGWFRWTLTLQ